MGKFSGWGALLTVTGLMLVVFKMIGAALGKDPASTDYTLRTLAGADSMAWLTNMSEGAIRNAVTGVVDAPLFMICIVVGVILLVIGGFQGK